MKLKHDKKLSELHGQVHTEKNIGKLNKTKASVNTMQSLILVTSQAVSATSTAIIGVRDGEFRPEIFQLCNGFYEMWRSMNQSHEIQSHIVQQTVHRLVLHSDNSGHLRDYSTSDLHRQATCDLESAVSDWHSSFTQMVKFHKDYIRTLHAWLELTQIQVTTLPIDASDSSSLVSLCDEWRQILDRLPDTVAAESIGSFKNMIHSISVKQTEESKIKKRMETYSKEVERKTMSMRRIENKLRRQHSNYSDIPADDPLAESKLEIASCRRKVEDEMARHRKAVKVSREVSMNNIQTGLPGIFQSIQAFSDLSTDAFRKLNTF